MIGRIDYMAKIAEGGLKMLGAQVPSELHWRFKCAAAERHESMAEALMNAVELYIAVGKDETKEDKENE